MSYVSKNLRHRAIFPACVIGNCGALSCFSPRSNLHGQFKKFRLGIRTSVHISGRHHSNHILGLSLLYLSNTSTVNIAQSHLQNITCPPPRPQSCDYSNHLSESTIHQSRVATNPLCVFNFEKMSKMPILIEKYQKNSEALQKCICPENELSFS